VCGGVSVHTFLVVVPVTAPFALNKLQLNELIINSFYMSKR